MAEPTRAEAEQILSAPKTLGGTVSWKQMAEGRRPRWRLEATVVVPSTSETLRLVGNVGRAHWGFALLMRNSPIRRFDGHSSPHRNPDGAVIETPHKHRWDDVYRDGEAYVSNDIDASDVNRAFLDFLAECNITLVGQYQQLLI